MYKSNIIRHSISRNLSTWHRFLAGTMKIRIHRFLTRMHSWIRATNLTIFTTQKAFSGHHLKFKFSQSPPPHCEPLLLMTTKTISQVYTVSTWNDIPRLDSTLQAKKRKIPLSLWESIALLQLIPLPQRLKGWATRPCKSKLLRLWMAAKASWFGLHKQKKKLRKCQNFYYRLKVWAIRDLICYWDRK